MNSEICKYCDLATENRRHGRCLAPGAEPIDGRSEVEVPHDCRHFTCLTGLRAAISVISSPHRPQPICVLVADEGIVYGYPFGSSDKPYKRTGRLVTSDGTILTYSPRTREYYMYPVKANFHP